MSMFGVFKRMSGSGKEQEIVGSIVEEPSLIQENSVGPATLVFRLDSRPDLVFHHPVSPLAARRRRGDRVKVHCKLNGGNVVQVDWIEKAS